MSAGGEFLLRLRFDAEVIYWRGPSPFFFVPLPAQPAADVRQVVRAVTYGWGMAPVEAKIGDALFTTALFPKDGTYFLPLKDVVRRKANITAGDLVVVELTVRPPRR